jgi:hypothetical protein
MRPSGIVLPCSACFGLVVELLRRGLLWLSDQAKPTLGDLKPCLFIGGCSHPIRHRLRFSGVRAVLFVTAHLSIIECYEFRSESKQATATFKTGH